MTLKLTLAEFLSANESVKLFKDTTDATNFYRALEQENTYLSILLLINEFQILGWYNLNSTFGITLPNNGLTITLSEINDVLDYRVDDCIATISNIPGIRSEYGNYLINDIFRYISGTDTFNLANENELLTKLAVYAGSKKSILREFLLRFSRDATFSISLSYTLESYILYRFLLSCKEDAVKKELMIYSNIVLQNNDRLMFVLRYLDRVFSELTQSDIISRLNMMKIKDNNAFSLFIKDLKDRNRLTPLVNLLDLVE